MRWADLNAITIIQNDDHNFKEVEETHKKKAPEVITTESNGDVQVKL